MVNAQGQSCSDDSCSDDESPKRKYREMLTRRPSYRKILNDLGGGEIAGEFVVYCCKIVEFFFRSNWKDNKHALNKPQAVN